MTHPRIPRAAIDALLRLGFTIEHGFVNIQSKKYGIQRKEYQMRNAELDIYLLQTFNSSWFYDNADHKWIHPDALHDHLAMISEES